MKSLVIIPAYNEAQSIGGVIEQVKKYVDHVVVVNDGSFDQTKKEAVSKGVSVVSHFVNRGLGGAIQTGFEIGKKLQVDILITIDADGQHDPKSIPLFIQEIQNGNDVVIGSRMLNSKGMPWYRILANHLGNLFTYFLFGSLVSDSQSGYRAFSKKVIENIQLKTNRMEVSSEIISEISKNHWKYREIPIEAIYTDYSLSKGQGFFVGIQTLLKLIVRRFFF